MSQIAERKRVTISVKRQFTIPQKYYELLGFESDAECILQDGGIFIRPLRNEPSDFSEEILADLITQGLSGQQLLARFKEQTKKVRPAVQKLIEEADETARSGSGKRSINDLFCSGKS
ncbi:MAG: AbrB family transcriptional regulator [Spirochaetes bacterium GWD1_61_31]|nr:MAG: AbrB family transcriptional regulator [Spirochaetes bacterium GWB1_60_80]OHD32667.1 MAG: AbrB family transcriptional regulator [Spirochaetes bacterium GWC1_61_12]OHD39273.1 MAG: AbrB family transcriptional regulator [Spirochaetes bacterium GWD1_61_31]OHD42093.1 MAG: AbrB family transcriptional regulator [Spirochaetes bacterium GWE1_60_18]OHD60973.1 MAG: AbrB family transcriptional regulator [Spirochaetes bacterium GWF1_60_12]HAP42779.1 AbrB family transcriptional regulator [Spirochaeta